MCWRETDLKMEHRTAAGLFLLHLRVSARVSFCASTTDTRTQKQKEGKESHSCVQLVQNGKHVRSSALGAAASSYATLTFSIPAKNQTKSFFFSFFAFLHLLSSGSQTQALFRIFIKTVRLSIIVAFADAPRAVIYKEICGQQNTFYYCLNIINMNRLMCQSENVHLWMLVPYQRNSRSAVSLFPSNVCFFSGQ